MLSRPRAPVDAGAPLGVRLPKAIDRRFTALACEVNEAVTSSLVLEDVLLAVCERIATALDVWECDLYEYYPVRGMIVFSAWWCPEMKTEEGDVPVGTVVTHDSRPNYWPVFDEGKVLQFHVDDPALDSEERQRMDKWGERSSLAVPLVDKGSVIGCLLLIEKRAPRTFTSADIELATMLAVPAAIAISNARLFRGQEEQSRQFDALLDSTRALTSLIDQDEVLKVVCRQTAEALGSDECIIHEFDPIADAIVFRAIYERSDPDAESQLIGRVYPLDEFPEDRTLMFGGTVVEERLSDPDLAQATRADMEEWGEMTCLSVPLAFGGQPVGLLVLIETGRDRHFSPEEVELARGLGEQAAVALNRAKLFREQAEHNERLVGLFETSRSLASELDAHQVLDRVRWEVAHILGLADAAVQVRLRGDDDTYLSPALALGSGETELGATVGAAERPPSKLARQAIAGLETAQGLVRGTSRLVVPLVLKGRAEGYLDISGERARPFTEAECELVQILASQAAVARENARLYQTVELQALTDGLTGLYNHRTFYEQLAREFARAQRYGVPLSLLMLDIDDFKRFNDTYGHPLGDAVLTAVGGVLRSQLRNNIDFAARYGGEEFTVLLPNTPSVGAEVVGKRLSREVSKLLEDEAEAGTAASADEGAPPPRRDGAEVVGERIRLAVQAAMVTAGDVRELTSVTVSVGVAVYPDTASNADELMQNADKALYSAKRLGKNRVEVYGS
jgi:diguanylate cyclase (GGDEF)-like protein